MASNAPRHLFLTPLLALGLTAVAVAAQPSDWEVMREQQGANYRRMLNDVPELTTASRVGDLLRLRTENKALVARTPLPTTDGANHVRATLDDLGQTALVRVRDGVRRPKAPPVVPGELQVNLADYSRPGRILNLAIRAQASYFSIVRSEQTPAGYSNVQFVETHDGSGGTSGQAQLTVNGSDGAGAPVNLTLSAPDFFTFARRHPAETERYLRPVLRELGQEAVFAPDPLVAWQMFPEKWRHDDEAARRVNDLLPLLDADDFRARDRAFDRLRLLGRAGAQVLVRMDRSALSPEQNMRLDRALDAYPRVTPAEVGRLREDVGFLLDCLYADHPALRAAALERLNEVAGRPVTLDLAGDDAARAAAIAALRRRLVG